MQWMHIKVLLVLPKPRVALHILHPTEPLGPVPAFSSWIALSWAGCDQWGASVERAVPMWCKARCSRSKTQKRFPLPGAALPSSDAGTRGVLFLLSPPDQHLHDTLVQLRQRPPGPVHLRQSGQLRSHLDKPQTANPSSDPAGSQVFWAIPWAEGPSLAGEAEQEIRKKLSRCFGVF